MTAGAEPIRCPRCRSPRAESLSPAVRDWFCCEECGHIWPREPAPGDLDDVTAELQR